MHKKGVVLLLFSALLAVSFIYLVSAADPFTEFFGNGAQRVFSDWAAGDQFNANLSKVLLGVIVAILVFSVAGNFPGLGDPNLVLLRAVLAAIVAFLSTSFILPEEVYAILLTYSALGFTLSTILPFIILAYWSFQLLGDRNIKNPFFARLLVQFIWGLFAAFLIYRLFFSVGTGQDVSGVASGFTWIIFLIAVAFVLFASAISSVMNRQKRKEDARRSGDTSARAAIRERQLADSMEFASEGDLKRLDKNLRRDS